MIKCQQVARECACFSLRKADRAVTQLYDEALREAGIRVTQFTVLVAAHLSGDTPVSQLAQVLVMDRTTLTRNLKPLEAQGLITIRAGADRREKRVTLTSRGRAMVASALPLWEQAERQITEGLGPARFNSLLTDLSKAVSLIHA
jgi:DNA-binding MarR family transcriptional regulator